jgi:hypothetical protein
MTTQHIAEVTDPITGDTTILTAATAPELDQLVEDHLEQHYPNTQDEDPASAGMGCQEEVARSR